MRKMGPWPPWCVTFTYGSPLCGHVSACTATRKSLFIRFLCYMHSPAAQHVTLPRLPPVKLLPIDSQKNQQSRGHVVCGCVSRSSSVVLRTSRMQHVLRMLTPAFALASHAALPSLLCCLPILRLRLRKPFLSLSLCLCVGRRVRVRSRWVTPLHSRVPPLSRFVKFVRCSCCLVLVGLLYLGVFPLSIDAVQCSPCCSALLVVNWGRGGACV